MIICTSLIATGTIKKSHIGQYTFGVDVLQVRPAAIPKIHYGTNYPKYRAN